jgi:hypothetical protein
VPPAPTIASVALEKLTDVVLEDVELGDGGVANAMEGVNLDGGTLIMTGGAIHGTFLSAMRMSDAIGPGVNGDNGFQARVEGVRIDVVGPALVADDYEIAGPNTIRF